MKIKINPKVCIARNLSLKTGMEKNELEKIPEM
jgi:hypothetical protein